MTVSRICLGGNSWGAAGHRAWSAFDAEASRPFFQRALDCGINFFDTAASYNAGASETVIGTELMGMAPRSELVITTKVNGGGSTKPNGSGLGRKYVMDSIDASLRRLKTDYVDVFMLHRYDEATPVEEILHTLSDVVRAGKARYVGASTMRATQFARLHLLGRGAGIPFIVMQNLYNLVDRQEEADMNPFCREEGVALTPYSPLARGTLAEPRRVGGQRTERAQLDTIAERYRNPRSTAIAERVAAVAGEIGRPASQVALSWLLHQPAVTAPVVGVTKLEQIDDAAAACELALSDQQIAALAEAN